MIKHFKATASLVFLGLYFLFHANVLSAFSAKDIISPCNGVWNNIQALVLNDLDDSELYYSFTGSDPLASGFSYDGPILIDAVGDISLNIAAVSKDGKRSDFKISYTVIPFSTPTNEDDAFFISDLQQNPIIKVSTESPFLIPSSYTFCMSNDSDSFHVGRPVLIDSENILERYVPCIIKGNGYAFHMVLQTLASEKKASTNKYNTSQLPFNVEEWDRFKFTNKKYIFKIDDSLWSGTSDEIHLDRSVPHKIYWQDVAFELGNPVETYELPAIPSIASEKLDSGAVRFYFEDADSKYLMKVREGGTLVGIPKSNIASSLVIDSVFGDEVSSDILFDVFYDGVLQGTIKSFFEIDKRPPSAPEIISSASQTSSRDKVSVSIKSEEGSTIYYAVCNGIDTSNYKSMQEIDNDVSLGEYEVYSGEKLEFGSLNGNATYYKISSYAVDSNGNKSLNADYSVVIDEYNVYFDSSYDSLSASEGDGSLLSPFKSFANAVKYVNSRKNTNLYLVSSVVLDNQVVKITSDCNIIGKDTSIILNGKSTFNIEKANVVIKDCFFTRNDSECSTSLVDKIFNIKNSTVTFDNCEVLGIFKKDSSIANIKSSSINILNSGFTLQTFYYGALLDVEKSDLKVVDSRFTASGETSVCFSIHGGTFYMEKSSCSSQGKVGRCIELVSVKDVRVKGSSLTSLNSVSSTSSGLFWVDKNTVVVEYEDNDENAL